MKHWRKQPWWLEAVTEFRDDDKTELDARYQKIIRKALDVVDDRLENGNFQMDQKTGQIVRVPVTMSDTHRVMKDLVDQQQQLRSDRNQDVGSTETINEKLVKLASQFAEMALKNNKPKETNTYEMMEEVTELEDLSDDKNTSVIPEVQPT